jgi:hypothetical protein
MTLIIPKNNDNNKNIVLLFLYKYPKSIDNITAVKYINVKFDSFITSLPHFRKIRIQQFWLSNMLHCY